MTETILEEMPPMGGPAGAPITVPGPQAHGLATESRFAFYRSLAARYWKPFVGMMALVAVYSAITAGRILALGVVLDAVRFKFTGEAGRILRTFDSVLIALLGPGFPSIIENLADNVYFAWFLGAMLALFLVAAVVMAVSFFFKESLGQALIVRMEVDIRKAIFQHLACQSVAYFNRQRSGDVISRLTNDVNAVRLSFKLFFEDLVQQPFIVLLSLAAAYSQSPILFAFTVPFYAVIMLPVLRSGKKVIKHGRGRLEKLSLVTEAIQQLFTGIRIVKAFGMERHEEEEFSQKNGEFVRSTLKLNRAKVKGRAFQELLYNVGTGAAVLLGVWLTTTGFIGAVEFIVFMGCMVQIYNPLKSLSSAWNQLQESRGG
ncbi:MAG TPA: ABC transporter transmembrane domain-containing protein, partial [Planctomycetota bacterium]|nr:ABC transporter transmembrane domain-containing protein [Planctomycetota bacterium]